MSALEAMSRFSGRGQIEKFASRIHPSASVIACTGRTTHFAILAAQIIEHVRWRIRLRFGDVRAVPRITTPFGVR